MEDTTLPPLFNPPSTSVDTQSTFRTEGSGRKPIVILLVEDDSILQDLYFDRFSRSGFDVLQAFDGMQALELIEQRADITIVLLDIMLPKLSGFDVLAQVRQNPVHKNLPIVVVSALSDIDDQARALQLGANEYITKGEVLPATVIEKIHKHALSVQRPEERRSDSFVLPPTPGSSV